ncbi:hypothetical protein BN1723_003702 [Verticillium longisporum]|uniref:PA14 domain-containing protein n=1 Tax=Verticillium longisporum TaxID=100787 RepID=A0A0G4M9I9_VERLO|nr:hypothetical protein BN1723_003702 [Verticillium longisporum]
MKLFSPAVNVEIISCTDDATFTHTTSVVRTLVFHARPPYVLVHEGYEGPVPTTVTFAPTGTDPGTIVVYTPTDAPEDEQTKKDGSHSIGPSSISPLPSSLEPIPSSVGPSSSQPSSLEPSSILPSSAQPSSFEPRPSSLGPSSIEPSSIIPSPSSFEPIPSSLRPSSIEPVSSIPSASSFEPLPSSALPSSAQPSSAQPSSVQPSSAQPSSAAPSSVAPSSAQPSSVPPSSAQPSSAAPSSVQPNFPAFSSLDVNYFHVTQPAFTGTTERVGIPPGTNPYFPPFSIYDDTPARLYMFTAVNHRAFLYAPVTGTYTITVPDSDEITLVWLGDKAISTWTRANADLEQDYNTVDGPEETTVFRIQLQAGTYTPFRLLWANAQGELSFIARVQAPDGRIIEDGDGSDSDYFVRFACDMSTPEYPPFGQDG